MINDTIRQTIFKGTRSQITYPLAKGKQLMSLKECKNLQILAYDPWEYHSTIHTPVTQWNQHLLSDKGAVKFSLLLKLQGPH